MRKKNKEASCSNSNSNLVHACTLGDQSVGEHVVVASNFNGRRGTIIEVL